MRRREGFASLLRYVLNIGSDIWYAPSLTVSKSMFFNLLAAVCTALEDAREYFLIKFTPVIIFINFYDLLYYYFFQKLLPFLVGPYILK